MFIKPRISYEELQERLLNIKNPRDQALLCIAYASLGRVGEIVKHYLIRERNPPIKKENIEFNPTKQKLYITLLTEKTMIPRTVPVSTIPRNTSQPPNWGEKWLTDIILNYSINCKKEELFVIIPWQARKIFFKWFPQFNYNFHLLRSWRATHLLTGEVTGKPLPRQIVQRMGGWRSISTMDVVYDQSITQDYENQI